MSPAAFPGSAIPSLNLLGRACGCRQRIGFDPAARSRAAFPSLFPGCSPSEKQSEASLAFAFVLPATLQNPRRSQSGRMPPGGGRCGSSRCSPEVILGGGGRFPRLGGERVPIANQCRGAGGESAASEKARCAPRPRAVTRLSGSLESATSRRAFPFMDLCLGFD